MAFRFNNTLIGRLMIGPIIGTVGFFAGELQRNTRRISMQWLGHLPAMIAVLAVVSASPTPLWAYAVSAYLGLAILKLRTFLEHTAHDRCSHRTAIVESPGIFGFLFLHNNLHVVHHKHPSVSWHKLPALYRANRTAFLERNGGYFYPSYAAIFRAYALRPKDPVAHPLFSKR